MKKDWIYKKLGELTKIKTGKLDANASSEDGIYPFFTCSKEPLRISSYSYDCECVLVAGNGDLNVKYYKGKFDAYQRTYIIETTPDSGVMTYYMYHFFNKYIETLRQKSIGGIIKYIKWGDLTEATIPIPPISIQESIVRELDAIHGILEKKQEQLRELNNLAQAIFYEMFGDPITNPKQWKVKKLGELTCKCANISWNKVGKYTRYDYVDLTSVNRETYQIEEPQNIDSLSAPSRAKQIIREGDVLFGTTRPTLKRVCVVPKQYDQQICSTGFCVLRPLECVNSQWLFHTLCADNFYEYIEPLQTGANYPAVSDSIVKSYSIPLPPLSLQQSFAAKIEAIEAQKQAVQQSIREVEALLAERMDNYFS